MKWKWKVGGRIHDNNNDNYGTGGTHTVCVYLKKVNNKKIKNKKLDREIFGRNTMFINRLINQLIDKCNDSYVVIII